MQKLLHRISLMIKAKKQVKSDNQEEKTDHQEKKIPVENSDTTEKKDIIKNKGILNLICLYQLENNLLIDEIIPNIAFKFSKIGNVKVEFYQKDLFFLTEDSIYSWSYDKNNNTYKSDNIEVSVYDTEFQKKNYDDLSVILVDNDIELEKYFLMYDFKILVENKDNTNKIIIEKKGKSFNIFNPFNFEPSEILNDYNFYTISKQYLIKKMLNYKLKKILNNKKDSHNLLVKYLDYLNIDSKLKDKLNIEFKSLKSDEKLDFIKKLNKYLFNQYEYSYIIN